MRYINYQPDATSCGPVALVNLSKWLDRGGTLKTVQEFKKNGFYDPHDGVPPEDWEKQLKNCGIKYKKRLKVTIQDIEKELDKGRAVILSYIWYNGYGKYRTTESWGHYTFIDGHTKCYFNAKNNTSSRLSIRTKSNSKKQLARWFGSAKRHNNSYKKQHTYPTMWSFKKQ